MECETAEGLIDPNDSGALRKRAADRPVTAKDLTREEQGILNKRAEALLQKGLFEQQELLADVAAALERMK